MKIIRQIVIIWAVTLAGELLSALVLLAVTAVTWIVMILSGKLTQLLLKKGADGQ